MPQSNEQFQKSIDRNAKINQHINNQIGSLRADGHNMTLGVSGSGNWHTNKCANLDELDGTLDEGSYFE